MKKLFGAFLALAALSGTAFAADLPVRKAPAAPEYATDWSGFSIGLLGGYGWASAKPDWTFTGGKALIDDPSPKGWVAGAYVGYNWNPGNFVVGVEGDFTFADLKETQTIGRVNIDTKLDRLASIRGRVGLLVTPNLLAYGTGGVGFGSAEAAISSGGTTFATARANHWGWVAGGGLEYSLGAKVKIRAEYLHYDLGEATYTTTPLAFSTSAKLTAEVIRAGLGFQF